MQCKCWPGGVARFQLISRCVIVGEATISLIRNRIRSNFVFYLHRENELDENIMNASLQPVVERKEMQFEHGSAVGTSQRWDGGQYCSIITHRGIVGCGIYDIATATEFGQAIAIAKGTPSNPLVVPEDLLNAKIVNLTPRASELGITLGMTGREAVEKMLQQPGAR
jgi:uncharacterized protein YunC (DUF1805 family)